MSNEDTIKLPPAAPPDPAPESFPEDGGHAEEATGGATAALVHNVRREQRLEPRVRVRWHGDVYFEGGGSRLCMIRSVSSLGGDILIESNLQKVRNVRLVMHVPPSSATAKPRTIGVRGKVVYTAYDSAEWMFRSGVSFTEFEKEEDRIFLHAMAEES